MTIKKPIIIIFLITFVLSLSLVFFKEGISSHVQTILWEIGNIVPKKPQNTTNEQSVYEGLFVCKTEKLDGEEYDVFEGWTRDLSAWEEGSSWIMRMYNNKIDNYYFDIHSDGRKVYIIENGEEKKAELRTIKSIEHDIPMTYKIYYKVGGIDDSRKGKCPDWEGDLVNAYIYKVILQEPEVSEEENIIFSNWECPNEQFIKIIKDGQTILANQNLKGWCNIKFVNNSMYYTLAKCDFLDESMINSIMVNGNTTCSKFNNSCFFNVYKFYFDTNLIKDEKNNISFENFYFNTRDISNKDIKFALRNYSLNNYYKTSIKKPINKYYLGGYNHQGNTCQFYWSYAVIDITDNIKNNSELIHLISKVEKNKADEWKRTGIIEEQGIELSLSTTGTLYCGNMENFMGARHSYDCVLKPKEVNIRSMRYW